MHYTFFEEIKPMSYKEDQESIEEGKKTQKVAIIGCGVIGSRLLSSFYAKQNGKSKSNSMSLSEMVAMNNMGFVTIQDVELPASQQYHHGYSRRDLKDFTKGNRNLKGRGRR